MSQSWSWLFGENFWIFSRRTTFKFERIFLMLRSLTEMFWIEFALSMHCTDTFITKDNEKQQDLRFLVIRYITNICTLLASYVHSHRLQFRIRHLAVRQVRHQIDRQSTNYRWIWTSQHENRTPHTSYSSAHAHTHWRTDIHRTSIPTQSKQEKFRTRASNENVTQSYNYECLGLVLD